MASLIRLSSRWRYQQLEEGGRSGAKREERREAKGEGAKERGSRGRGEPNRGLATRMQAAGTHTEAVSFSSRVRFKSGAPTHWNQLTSVDEAWPLTECICMGPRADLDADLLSGRLRRGNPAKVTTITLFGPESLAFDGGRSGPVHPASPTSRIILKWGGVVAGWTTSAYSGNYRCTCFRSNTCVRTDRSQLIRACRRELRAGPPRTQYATCNGEHVQEASGPSVPFEIRRPLHRRFVCRSCSSMASSTVDIDQLVVESNAYVH
uniref:Uncharacterized protein n=1 Tax=Oryza barthii TaxID=65489 RepID=A0A0D3EWY8_9ORYZ